MGDAHCQHSMSFYYTKIMHLKILLDKPPPICYNKMVKSNDGEEYAFFLAQRKDGGCESLHKGGAEGSLGASAAKILSSHRRYSPLRNNECADFLRIQVVPRNFPS